MKHLDTLYVGWQDRSSRRWYPVGRLMHTDAEEYVFEYLRGADTARQHAAFRGIAQFPDFQRVYRATELFPFFRNRVKSFNRADSDEELRRLGLAEPHLDLRPFDILSRSYGRRVTDRFEIYPPPVVKDDIVELTFFARGVRHLNEETASRWQSGQRPTDPIELVPEDDNEYDPHATQILDADRRPMGYLPWYYTTSFAQLLKAESDYSLTLRQFNPDPSYPQHRFLLHFQGHAPKSWSFPQSDLYDPVADDSAVSGPGARRL